MTNFRYSDYADILYMTPFLVLALAAILGGILGIALLIFKDK